MNVGQVKFIRPKSTFLQQYIKGYYIHTSTDVNFKTQITFYQNITSTISIYENTQMAFDNKKVIQTHAPNSGFSAFFVAKVPKFQEVEFNGLLNRIAIVFYPLGVNHFIQQPISQLLTSHYSSFCYFENDFKTLLPKLYNSSKLEEKRDLLDHFLQSKFYDFPEKRLTQAVHLIINRHEIKVSEIAAKIGISRRTLLRLFKKHLGYSIEEYMSVVKFRKSLLHFQQQEKVNMTEIALESDYYDQADFNHQFKFRTGMTPSDLFARLEIMDDTLFWKTS